MTNRHSNTKASQAAPASPPPFLAPTRSDPVSSDRPASALPPIPPSASVATKTGNRVPLVVGNSDIGKAVDDRDERDSQLSKEHWLWREFWQFPSWLTSTLLHVAIILILALIPVRDEIGNTLSLILGLSESNGEGEELESFDLNSFSMESETGDDIGKDLATLTTELEPSLIDISNLNMNVAPVPLTLKAGLSSRTGLMRDAMLKAYGGTSETERAVAMGLEWLKKNQSSDGSWSLAGPYSEGGVNENRPAATAMALLAFMGAGNTHLNGSYQNNVARGVDFLLTIQDEDGFFAAKATGIQKTYSQAQASIALCELYGMTGDEKLKLPSQRAVRWAVDAQSDAGGWRYQPREDSDTSVTGWYVMALISARMAGLDVDSEALERVHQFLDSVQRTTGENRPNPQGDKYAYVVGGRDKDSMTAEGILCRMYLGWKTTDPRIVQGCDYLATRPISNDMANRNYYYWYYATNSLHHAGGAAWFRWNEVMREALPAMQIQSGRERGSWPPQGDPHGDAGGRLYSTVLAILCLEAYYRHMPLSEMAELK